LLDVSSPISNEVAALDSLLFLRGPFPVINEAGLLNLTSDRNTRLAVFVLNLPAVQAPSVIVNLVDSNNQSYDVPAEDVRPVAGTQLVQIVFRLPNNLSVGICSVRIKALGQTTNVGVIRIRI
jgi:hypothetical protein